MATPLPLESVIGFGGAVTDGLILHPDGQTLIYPLGSMVVVRPKNDSSQQEFLQGHTDEVRSTCPCTSASCFGVWVVVWWWCGVLVFWSRWLFGGGETRKLAVLKSASLWWSWSRPCPRKKATASSRSDTRRGFVLHYETKKNIHDLLAVSFIGGEGRGWK